MSAALEFEVQGRVAVVTLNRPDSFNAIDAEAAVSWCRIAHDVVDRDDIGAMVLAARGRAFCAGGDLRAMTEGGGGMVRELAQPLHEGILTLVASAKPVVAAVNGAVAGGGIGLLLSSDYAIASESATFAARYTAMGLSPDMSVTALLSRAVGERRALQFVLGDRALSAEEARDWGLIAEVLPAEEVAARARELAEGWAANELAIGQSKRLIRAGSERPLAATLDDEAETIARLFDSAESARRVGAFLSKSTRA